MKFHSSCNCGGSYTGIYKIGAYEVYYTEKGDKFKFRHRGITLKQWTNAERLEEYLSAKIPHLFIRG